MRNSVETIIAPIYDDAIDLTGTWGDFKHPDIFPAVYRRWRAPKSSNECQKMIEDLAGLIVCINTQYDEARGQAIRLGLNPMHDTLTKDKLKSIRSARNRYEAVRRAYIHWLSCTEGDENVLPETGVTQYSAKARLDALAGAVKKLLEVYIADLSDEADSEKMLDELIRLRRQLEAVFVT
jgi:hypothetical protein